MHKQMPADRSTGRILKLAFAAGICLFFAAVAGVDPVHAASGESERLAFLSVQLLNDNAEYEPTSDAERARMAAIESKFKTLLEGSGDYKFVTVPPEFRAKIEAGAPLGECGGCEFAYGKQLNAETIAWIKVHKVSNLILNLNVYMADVSSERMTFVRSVDMRGNTDRSWDRALTYLVENYLLTPAARG